MSLLSQILPRKESKEYFLTLGIEENFIRAAVIELFHGKAKILGIGKSEFSEEKNESEACDIAITMAEKASGADLLTEKVIFALPQIYLDGENVKPEYLKRLKKVTKELNLKAHGFIDYSSAISFYLENSEGSPATVILMDIARNHMTVSLVRIGKVAKNIIVQRGTSLVEDFTSALPQLQAEILPSRIILYDNLENTEDHKEELLKFPWHKHSIFMHTPKIEVLSNEKILTAIVEAASTSFLPAPPDGRPTLPEEVPDGAVEETVKETGEVIEEAADEIIGQNRETAVEADIKGENFGFVEESTLPLETEPLKTSGRKLNLPQVKLPELKLPGFRFPNLSIPGKSPLFIAGILVLAALVFLGISVMNYPKATVNLIVFPLKSEQNLKAVFATEGKSDGAVTARTESLEVEGSKKAATSGKAQIGDKATGEVTIYNKTTSGKTFTKSMVLTNGPLKFTLNDEVKVASASETSDGITFGKTGAKITAQAIGPEGNLPAQSEFKFTDLSEIVATAKNSQALSGGTSREIPSVSREDRLKMEEALLTELIGQAKQKLAGKLNAGERLLDEPVNTVVSAKKFSAEAGSEAKELTLDMKVKVEVYIYNQKDLEELARTREIKEIPDFRLDPDKLSIKVVEAEKTKTGEINTSLKLTSYYLPVIDADKIALDLSGKSYREAEELLIKVNHVAGFQIIADKSLPFFDKILPTGAKNINLRVISR